MSRPKLYTFIELCSLGKAVEFASTRKCGEICQRYKIEDGTLYTKKSYRNWRREDEWSVADALAGFNKRKFLVVDDSVRDLLDSIREAHQHQSDM